MTMLTSIVSCFHACHSRARTCDLHMSTAICMPASLRCLAFLPDSLAALACLRLCKQTPTSNLTQGPTLQRPPCSNQVELARVTSQAKLKSAQVFTWVSAIDKQLPGQKVIVAVQAPGTALSNPDFTKVRAASSQNLQELERPSVQRRFST